MWGHMIKVKLVVLLLVTFSISFLLADFDEYYFTFEVQSRDQLNVLTKIISIDKVEGNIVHAYANNKGLSDFLEQDIAHTMLPHPGSLIIPEMSSSIERTRSWDSYPTYEAYVEMMYTFAEDYPELCTVINYGQTINGRDILFLKISDNINENEDEPEFLYTSSMHGDETTGYVLLLRLSDYLLSNYGTDQRLTNIVDNIEIWINPLANPDGTYYSGNHTVAGARRFNANGVDLNRNFADPEDGQHPDGNPWQPENIIMMDISEKRNFVHSANFHGGTEVINYPWDTWSTRHPDNEWFQKISQTYADNAQENSPNGYMDGYEDGITNGFDWYSISGGRQDFMNYFRNCREVTVEISDTKLLPAYLLPDHWEYNRESLLLYMEECLYGFRGIVSNQEGNPVYAQIEVLGHDFDNSQIFSDKVSGNYHRMIESGNWNIEVSAYAYSNTIVNSIEVTDGSITYADVVMEPSPDAINLTGLVLNSENEIIPNATIEVQNTLTAPVTSNVNGEYSLYLLPGNFNFLISAPGYLPSEFSLAVNEANNEYDFQLSIGPVIEVNTFSINKELPIDTIDTETILITNCGGGTLQYNIWMESGERDLTGSHIICSNSNYVPGEDTDWIFTIFNLSPDDEWIKNISIEFPEGIIVNSCTDFVGGSGGDLLYDETTGNGIEVNWNGETTLGYGCLHGGEVAQAIVDVSISPDFDGSIDLIYHITGDEYGEEPHEIFDVISISNPLGWISIDLISGNLDSGESQEIEITFDTNNLAPGEYNCNIIIDQIEPGQVIIPVELIVTSSSTHGITIPDQTRINGNYPNPFNPDTNINFYIGSETITALEIYNLKGQKINTILNRKLSIGEYNIPWEGLDHDGNSVPSGLYLYKLSSGDFQQTRKMLLLK